ncbi:MULTISPECIES: hypothetical protein [unclassified Streptomyces]|uniref:Uncharacterized protein n=1 Tax=Streptomyces bugieae TaxID=3098223 RepID=A0ABU7NKW5_9ACTN|nr:hypothetical protein [Streptomyces sp. DSM 41528]
MASDTDTVEMKLTFWREGKKPGDTIEVPVDEVPRWKGFAEPVATGKGKADATEDRTGTRVDTKSAPSVEKSGGK